MLVRESESSRHHDNRGRKLQHDHYTGPWAVTEVLQTGLSLQSTMRGRKQRTRHVSTAKPYYLRPHTLRHSFADEFAQYAWVSDFKLSLEAVNPLSFDTLTSFRQTTSPSAIHLQMGVQGENDCRRRVRLVDRERNATKAPPYSWMVLLHSGTHTTLNVRSIQLPSQSIPARRSLAAEH